MTHSAPSPAACLVLLLAVLHAGACAGGAEANDPADPMTANPSTGTIAGSGGGAAGSSGGSSAAGTGAAGSAGTGSAGGGGTASAGSGGGNAGSGAAGTTSNGGSGGDAADAGDPPTAGDAPDPGAPDSGPGDDVTIGEGGTVEETIVVESGDTFDGENKRYRAGSGLGDGSQSEDQQPVFRLEDGARLINVVLGAPAADGIHTYGDATLENIVWEDVGEDALTIKEEGTVTLDGGSADLAEDKIFQINAASTFRVSNFTAANAGKFIRQNGGTDFEVNVFIDACDISNMDEAIFRTDSSASTVTMTNTRYSNIGEELFMGVTPANVTQENNEEY